jgi:FKBP-type peptidyl-prolyl cis-trans isomerase FklB
MKRLMVVASLSALVAGSAFAADNAVAIDKEKVSYALGYVTGVNFKRDNIDVDQTKLMAGLETALSGKKATMSDQEIQSTLMAFEKQLVERKKSEFETLGKKNAEEGVTFLKENAKKSGVVTLPNGLQYKVVEEGKGAMPKASDTVSVEYEGTFINGEVFDSSYKRGKPVSFQVQNVIPAWSQALQLMKAGSTWMVYAPADLAYGKTGIFNGPIGPQKTLVFKIHLISVDATPAPAATPTIAHDAK